MHIVRTLVALLVALGIWLPSATPAAHAAETSFAGDANSVENSVEDVGVHCTGGICTVRLELPGLEPLPAAAANVAASFLLKTAQENISILPQNAGIEISDDVQLTLPVGNLPLLDTQLVLAHGADGQIERLRGTAEVPFPQLPWLDEMQFDAPLRADIGMELGDNLAHLNAPLDPERPYLFLNFDAGMHVSAPFGAAGDHALALSVPRGQNATLIIDPKEPLVYLAGHITMRHTEQVALLGQLLDPEGSLAFVPDAFPVQELVTLQVSGALTDDLEEAFLQVGGGFALRSAASERWLGVEMTPISIYGLMTLNQQGMWLNGLASSSIHPERFLDGAMQAEIFVPFSGELRNAYVQLDSGLDVPLVGVYTAGATRLAAPELTPKLPFAQRAEPAGAPAEVTPQEMAEDNEQTRFWHPRPAIASISGAVVDGAVRSYDAAANATQSGYSWMSSGVVSGYDVVSGVVAEGAACGWQQTERTWCSVTGLCESNVSACGSVGTEPVVVAAE
jgi:hypothetical protein